MEDVVLRVFDAITSLLPQLAILGASIYYLTRGFTLEGILLCIGTVGNFFITIFYVLIFPYLLTQGVIASSVEGIQAVRLVAGIFSFFSNGLFAAGLILLIKKVIDRKNDTTSSSLV